MTLEINNYEINVEIHYKNNKNLYIRALDEKTLEVTCNPLVSKMQIKKLIQENQSKIFKMLKQKEEEKSKNQFFWYLGKPYEIVYLETKIPYFDRNCLYVSDEKALLKFYNAEVKRIFTSEVERIVPYFKDIPSFSLKFRKMTTRWGVNNLKQKTITLNTELLKKDLDLLDYVIIHELCHFYEANHSERFWRQVEKYYPHYKEARRRLR